MGHHVLIQANSFDCEVLAKKSMAEVEAVHHVEGACKSEPKKLQSFQVAVLEPYKGRVKDGKIRLFGGRTRTSSRNSSGKFRWEKDVWTEAQLFLTPTLLCYEIKKTGVCEILLEDIIGVCVSEVPPVNRPLACEMNVHLFPITNPTAKKKVRNQYTAIIQFDGSKEFTENLQVAKEWKAAILLQKQRTLRNTFGTADGDGDDIDGKINGRSFEESLNDEVVSARNFLVFINPMAGAQKGVQLFKKHVQPMLDIAEISYKVVCTERQNHALEMMKTYDLSKVNGILISSGDGLLYEVINGVMGRQDWDKAIKIPIGMLPTGSGNAMCASTLYESNEEYGLETAAFQIISGGVVPMDLATVQLPDGSSSYMAIMTSWGIVADVDIESEKFRKIGKTRFLIGALRCIWKKRVYKGRLSYLVSEGASKEPEVFTIKQDPNAQETTSHTSSEGSEGNKEISDDSFHTSTERPPADQDPPPAAMATPPLVAATSDSPRPTNLPATNLLPPLNGPVPDTWETKEDNFIALSSLMVPLMSSDFYGDPGLPIGSGNLRLLWVDGNDITRKGVLDVMTRSGGGTHTELENVCRIDVKAFRVEPLTETGIMTVDGEVTEYGTMQAQVHPRLGRVMSRRRKT